MFIHNLVLLDTLAFFGVVSLVPTCMFNGQTKSYVLLLVCEL